VPAGRLIQWRTGDGWEPLCRALGLSVPSEPFPHVNTTGDFRTMARFDR
jgi:Sulfotransferase domain